MRPLKEAMKDVQGLPKSQKDLEDVQEVFSPESAPIHCGLTHKLLDNLSRNFQKLISIHLQQNTAYLCLNMKICDPIY